MVLGLIDFLLGGKKKTKVSKTAQVATPATPAGATKPEEQVEKKPDNPAENIPDGVDKPTENTEKMEFEDSKKEEKESQLPSENKAINPTEAAPKGPQKKSVSEAINKLHGELKESGERVTEIVTDLKELENNVNTISHRVDELEEGKKATDEKLSEMDENMTKFLSLYELINNQYNPFVDKDSMPQKVEAKKVALDSEGNPVESSEGGSNGTFDKSELDALKGDSKDGGTINIGKAGSEDLDSVLLELDTLNIEEAAGNAVPLTELKNNTNSLVVILSWLEYLIKKVGIDETRNSLRYYTEVLRWTTPEVYFELDKYLRGMKDVEVEEGSSLGVRDHIVSLYFISKLNEKQLDEKLTNAVLQIIKQ